MLQYWQPHGCKTAFGTGLIPFDGGTIAHVTLADYEANDLASHFDKNGHKIFDFVHDLFIGYRAEFLIATTEGEVPFSDALAVAEGRNSFETILKNGVAFCAGIGKFDVIHWSKPIMYSDLKIYGQWFN
jgi:hypothetical protein